MLFALIMEVSLHLRSPCAADRDVFFLEVEDRAYRWQCEFRDDMVEKYNCDALVGQDATKEVEDFCALH